MINFGHSTEELKHFVFFEGSGYTPLCTPCSLQYNIPLWYSSHGGFNFLDNWNSQNKFVSEQKNTSISVLHSDWDYSSMHFQECFRLNIGFTINPLGSPVLPTLLPRPGVLSPSPTVEGFSFTLDSEATCPETYAPLSFSAIFPAGQVPSLAFIGWTTPSFQFKESHFTERKREESCSCSPREYSGQHVEVCDAPSKRKSSSDSSPEMSFQTAFMVCLSDLLPTFTQQLTAPVRYVGQSIPITQAVSQVFYTSQSGILYQSSILYQSVRYSIPVSLVFCTSQSGILYQSVWYSVPVSLVFYIGQSGMVSIQVSQVQVLLQSRC